MPILESAWILLQSLSKLNPVCTNRGYPSDWCSICCVRLPFFYSFWKGVIRSSKGRTSLKCNTRKSLASVHVHVHVHLLCIKSKREIIVALDVFCCNQIYFLPLFFSLFPSLSLPPSCIFCAVSPSQSGLQITQQSPINPVEGSSVILNSQMVTVLDSGVPCHECEILVSNSSSIGKPYGHFANSTKNLDDAIYVFTYGQVVNGEVVFSFSELGKTLQYTQNVEIRNGNQTALAVSAFPIQFCTFGYMHVYHVGMYTCILHIYCTSVSAV